MHHPCFLIICMANQESNLYLVLEPLNSVQFSMLKLLLKTMPKYRKILSFHPMMNRLVNTYSRLASILIMTQSPLDYY